MGNAVAVAVRDLEIRIAALDEVRKAFAAGDPVRAEIAARKVPSWVLPATADPALVVLRAAPRHDAQPARDWHPDGFTSCP